MTVNLEYIAKATDSSTHQDHPHDPLCYPWTLCALYTKKQTNKYNHWQTTQLDASLGMSGRSVINYFTVSHRRHTPTDRPDRHPAVDFTSVHPDTSLCTVTNSFSPPAPELCVSLHLGQDAVSCVQYDTAIFKSIFSRMQRYRNLT